MKAEAELCRRQLHTDYVQFYLRHADTHLCRDVSLLQRASAYLQMEEETAAAFTEFPVDQAVREALTHTEEPTTRLRKFIKALELLENMCRNLLLQPWRREFRTVKMFTAPFVYVLLPVFSHTTIQSLLTSVGYLPPTDTQPNAFTLGEGFSVDRASLFGFELLLARAESLRILHLHDNHQLGAQELMNLLLRSKSEEAAETNTTTKDEETKEDAGGTKPMAKPRRRRLGGVDRSIMEMQMTYPDLAFRGRPLLSATAQAVNGGRGVHERPAEDAEASELVTTPPTFVKETAAAPRPASLRITMRARPTPEPPAPTQPTPTDLQNKSTAASPGHRPHKSTEDEEEEEEEEEDFF